MEGLAANPWWPATGGEEDSSAQLSSPFRQRGTSLTRAKIWKGNVPLFPKWNFWGPSFLTRPLQKDRIKTVLNGWNHHSSTRSARLQRGFAATAANKRQPGVACLPCWETLGERVSVGRRNSELPKSAPWTRCLLSLWLMAVALGGLLAVRASSPAHSKWVRSWQSKLQGADGLHNKKYCQSYWQSQWRSQRRPGTESDYGRMLLITCQSSLGGAECFLQQRSGEEVCKTVCRAAECHWVSKDQEGCRSLPASERAWTSVLYLLLFLMDANDKFTGVLCGMGNKNLVLCGKTVVFTEIRVLSKLQKHQGERTLTSQILQNSGTDFICDTCEILLLLIQSRNYNWLGISILLTGNRRTKFALLKSTLPELSEVKESDTFLFINTMYKCYNST